MADKPGSLEEGKNHNACLMSKHMKLNLLVLIHFIIFFLVDLKQGWEKGEI